MGSCRPDFEGLTAGDVRRSGRNSACLESIDGDHGPPAISQEVEIDDKRVQSRYPARRCPVPRLRLHSVRSQPLRKGWKGRTLGSFDALLEEYPSKGLSYDKESDFPLCRFWHEPVWVEWVSKERERGTLNGVSGQGANSSWMED